MPEMVPVDHDPFGGAEPLRLTVRPQGVPNLVPVDHDPFAAEPVPSTRQLTLDLTNQMSAASQRTTPVISAQTPNLISDDVHESDAGEVMYRDKATGQLIPTDQNKHVALRDPADNKVKVYARTTGFYGTDEGRLSSMGRLLSIGAMAGSPSARPGIPSGVAPAPTREALLQASDQAYTTARGLGVEIDPMATGVLATRIQGGLEGAGFRDYLVPKTFRALTELGSPVGETATIADIEGVRRALSKAAGDPAEKAAATRAIAEIDRYMSSLSPNQVLAGDATRAAEIMQEGRGNYAAAKRSERIGEAASRAELQASSAGSGANIDNAMRQQIKSILLSPKKARGFSEEELEQMRHIVQGTFTGNAARLLGKLAPTGLFSAAVPASIGYAAGGAYGAAALPIIGTVAKKLGDVMTANQLARLDELVRSRSPLAKSIENSAAAWQSKFEELAARPSTPRLAAFNLASRNLANNLASAGIQISPREMLMRIQGSVTGRAEEDQRN